MPRKGQKHSEVTKEKMLIGAALPSNKQRWKPGDPWPAPTVKMRLAPLDVYQQKAPVTQPFHGKDPD